MRGVQASGEMGEMVAFARPRAAKEEQRGDGGGEGDRREDAVGGRKRVDRRVAGLDGEVPPRAGSERGHGLARAVGGAGQVLGILSANIDERGINSGVDESASGTRGLGRLLSLRHSGQIQSYLGTVAVGMLALLILYAWLA